MYRFAIWVNFLLTLRLFAVGAWYQEPLQILKSKKDSFSPQFTLIKAGTFSNNGHLTPASWIHPESLTQHCSSSIESRAWVSHRLNQGEKLSSEAGKTLGRDLTQLFKKSCFSTIELDIETLKQFETWLKPFLKEVKSNLPDHFKLTLAVPVLSPQALSGHFWSLRDGVSSLQWVDGLDVMAYDSGASSPKDYAELFKNTFFFVMELVKQSPGKTIVVGLPAYSDQTKVHRPENENLEIVFSTLKPFTPFQLQYFCRGEVKLAYYAGWTLTPKDLKIHKLIEEWTHEICKKNS
jgi:hypothetical protein